MQKTIQRKLFPEPLNMATPSPARLKQESLGDVVIRCEDNLAFMQSLPDESIKLIITSPPYNIGKPYERRNSLELYTQAQAMVIKECVRLLHPQGSICWQVGNHVAKDGEIYPLDIILYPLFKNHGLHLRIRII